ncbi:MAG TPA: PAS domain-containing protein [Burkholderiales bacterium]|nr:PAS domain-containing protein [Burkholderiales bacterium]
MLWRARPDLSCEYASPAWLQFTGYSAEQALGDGWSRVVHAEDLARWLDTCVRAFDGREPFEVEYRMRRRDGEYRWVVDRAAPRFGSNGLFLGYAGVVTDIDERKRRELWLARELERERRLRSTAEESSRAREGFLASVLGELQAPTRAIAAWASHLRQHVAPGSEAAESLEAIIRNARLHGRIVENLLALSGHPEAAAVRAGEAPLLRGVRVLVVEDDAQARAMVLKVLRAAGAEARAVENSAEALRTLDEWRPDIMLSDMSRAEDGYLLIRAVRALPAERGGCLRAAAITGNADSAAVAAGYDAQLAKPVEPVALLATVARLVQPAGV